MEAAPRLLLVEGNTAKGNAFLAAAGADSGSGVYARALRRIAPGAVIDVVHPADGEVSLPAGQALADYDGAVVGGSGLNAYLDRPEVTRQIELTRAILKAGVPMLGSCWGAQLGAVAAGGEVARSPHGREIGIARKVALTPAGRGHPLYEGKAGPFDAIAVHYDEITRLPAGAEALAENGHSPVQALAFSWRGGTFWGVQYHTEYDLHQIGRLISGYAKVMVAEGFFPDAAGVAAHTEALVALDREPTRKDLAWRLGVDSDVLDPALRQREIRNWIDHLVLPRMAARG